MNPKLKQASIDVVHVLGGTVGIGAGAIWIHSFYEEAGLFEFRCGIFLLIGSYAAGFAVWQILNQWFIDLERRYFYH